MDDKLRFLYLSQDDLLKLGVTDMKRCVSVLDQMFKTIGHGDYLMGGPEEHDHGAKIFFPKKKRCEKMPVTGPDRRFTALVCYLGGDFNVCCCKWYGSNLDNKNKGLPRSILMLTLNDVETGAPLSYMSANLISATRTGASPGVAAKYLAKTNSRVLGVVGAGVINRACVSAIAVTCPKIETIYIYDVFSHAAQRFAEYVESELGLKAVIAKDLEDCVRASDIITSATAGDVQPEFKDDWLKEGVLILLTGAAVLSQRFHTESLLVADNWHMNKLMAEEYIKWESYQAGHPVSAEQVHYLGMGTSAYKLREASVLKDSDIVDLSDIAVGKVAGREDQSQKVLYISGGLPMEDAAWATTLYHDAIAQGIGQTLSVWDSPYWA